ncbi:hypothetical protein [Paracnuella aquatica]|uniref:hypothetical protein n=1 Tax=Paracnuella aquatica TaxID=2268757 RepID=UPI000F4F479A|nr:hypothetical protein [Paracnuella aquatica]RPD45104.1 hypothetical protein DRJ53_15805 [Paracnuella aquatica]
MLADLLRWLLQLQGFELILWCIALFFSLLFLVQTIISFFIGGDSSDFDGDADGDATSFFTVRNLIVFFTMFGWSGLAAHKAGLHPVLVVLIALLAGTAMVALLLLIMKRAAGMRQSGTLQLKNAVSQVGETYLRIPAGRSGMGKVQVQVQGRLVELDAMTDDSADIASGRPIKVVSTLNERILIVTSSLS